MYPGKTKVAVCQRLGNSWQDLADYFDIPANERQGFTRGREPHGVWEWLEAATGGIPANEYPWGSEWRSEFANTDESRLGRTTAVGLYPQGASPIRVLDMSCNSSGLKHSL
jgi:hypothetical protein